MNQIPTPIRDLSLKISLQVDLQISPKWHGLSQTSGCLNSPSKDILMPVDSCFFFFFFKKINLLIPLCTFNFLIQKWCLKESYLFSNFPTTWTYKKILLYHVNIFCFLFLLSLPCKKLFSNATTLSI